MIGSCGSEEKIKFVKSVGYDDAFNYKTEKVDEALKRLAPKGVDCYFDNVRLLFYVTYWLKVDNSEVN